MFGEASGKHAVDTLEWGKVNRKKRSRQNRKKPEAPLANHFSTNNTDPKIHGSRYPAVHSNKNTYGHTSSSGVGHQQETSIV